MSALQVQLMDIGWRPDLPNNWYDEEGDSWQINPNHVGDTMLIHDINRTIQSKLLAKASQFYLGKGLELGASFIPERSHHAYLRKSGKYKEAGLLASIVTSGIWTKVRGCHEKITFARRSVM